MPFLTLDDYLGLVSSELSPALVSPEHVARIRDLARRMPAFSMVGFESELGTDVPAVDFAVGVRSLSGDRAILARWLAPSPTSPATSPVPAGDRRWEPIRAFTDAWADPRSLLFHHVHSVWLEYDLQQHGEPPVVPNVLFGMSPADTSREGAWTVIQAALRLLYGAPPAALVGHLEACLAAARPQEQIAQVGVMLARELRAVRVCLSTAEAEQIPAYLGRIGWEGEGRPVADVLRAMAPFYRTVALDVDIGARLLPRIGLELYPDQQRRPWVDPAWQRLLDHLTERGQCSPAKRDALLRWPGHRRAQLLWTSTILRGLNHLKLTYVPGRAPTAKAYFGLVHAPASPG